MIGISQSGETADTLAALKLAKRLGLEWIFGICNVLSSMYLQGSFRNVVSSAHIYFTVRGEKAAYRRHRIDCVVTAQLPQIASYFVLRAWP